MMGWQIKSICLSVVVIGLLGQLTAHADSTDAPDVKYFNNISERASAGDSNAQVCLAELYAYGVGTPRNTAAEIAALRTAADAGSRQARLLQAELLIGKDKDIEAGSAALHKLFDEGYAPAAVDIGFLYSGSEGPVKDEKQELEWITKGASLGDYIAQLRLGLFYHFGDLVKQDDAKATDLLNRAASQPIPCWAEFGRWVPYFINGYLVPFPKDKNATGNFGLWFTYKDGRAKDVRLMGTSGDSKIDEAWLNAARAAHLPPWPNDYLGEEQKSKTFGFWFSGSALNADYVRYENALKQLIFNGFQVIKGPSSHDEVTFVNFDLIDGKPSEVFISSPSGDLQNDKDLKNVILSAKYPALPTVLTGEPMHFSLPINLSHNTFTPTQEASTQVPPSPVTPH